MWKKTNKGLYRQFKFRDFNQAWEFMNKVAELAERRQHHPSWSNNYNTVDIYLITHDADDSITDGDHKMAQEIDELYSDDATNGQSVPSSVKIYTDGGSRGNPGPSASGFVILDMDDKIIVDKGVYLGITTNNQAEYTALKLALEEAEKLGIQDVQVFMDSMLVVNQIKGIFKMKNQDLKPIYDAIKRKIGAFNNISFTHVPRAQNKLADAAVNRALDAQAEKDK